MGGQSSVAGPLRFEQGEECLPFQLPNEELGGARADLYRAALVFVEEILGESCMEKVTLVTQVLIPFMTTKVDAVLSLQRKKTCIKVCSLGLSAII